MLAKTDFAEKLQSFAKKIDEPWLESMTNEAATRQFLVQPFLEVLGYNTNDPTEVFPEYGANLDLPGVKKDKHVDYAILQDGKPVILIEVKPYGSDPGIGLDQLFTYFFHVDEVRLGIATNGVRYQLYADLEKPGKMDKTPYLDFSILEKLREVQIEALQKISKPKFNIEEIVEDADGLKYTAGIVKLLYEQYDNPEDDFVYFFFKKLYDGHFTGKMKAKISACTRQGLQQFVREKTNAYVLEKILGNHPPVTPPGKVDPPPEFDTSQEEIDGFYIVKSILWQVIRPDRLHPKDTRSYFNVLLDGNTWRPIVRFYFNNPDNKKLELVNVNEDGSREYEKVAIDNLNDIYQYADRLKETVSKYEAQA